MQSHLFIYTKKEKENGKTLKYLFKKKEKRIIQENAYLNTYNTLTSHSRRYLVFISSASLIHYTKKKIRKQNANYPAAIFS